MIKKPSLLLSLLLLLLSLSLLVGSIYAWFASTRHITDFEVNVGSLDSELEIEYWNVLSAVGNKWEELPSTGAEGQVYISFGSLIDMGEVPEGSDVYLKIKGKDSSGAVYLYNITIASIDIGVYYLVGSSYQKVIGNEFIDTINYFAQSGSQMCIEFNADISENSALAPSQAFAPPLDAAEQITSIGQSFTEDEFISQEEYLYVKLSIRQAELADIVRRIPVQYLPYRLELTLNIECETRTAD